MRSMAGRLTVIWSGRRAFGLKYIDYKICFMVTIDNLADFLIFRKSY